MKIMIISDIHGGYENLNKVLNIYSSEEYDKLFILGDIYGNNNMDNYNISKLFAKMKGIAVRGNCDVLLTSLPDMYKTVIDDIKMLLIHDESKVPPTEDVDIVFCGHTHQPNIEFKNNKYYINPGSISKSRVGVNSFGVFNKGKILIKSINNTILAEASINGKRKKYD